mgnify:CR=1 FL=1
MPVRLMELCLLYFFFFRKCEECDVVLVSEVGLRRHLKNNKDNACGTWARNEKKQKKIEEQEKRLAAINEAKLKDLDIFIDDTPNISPVEIRAKSRRLAKQYRDKGGLSLVVIDYIQLMQMPSRSENGIRS